MSELPAPGTSPQAFLEQWLPPAFAQAELPDSVKRVELTLGVRLLGAEGGDFLLRFKGGELCTERSAIEAAPFALIQRVDDWRGALWEEKGGAFGQQASLLFHPAEAARVASAPSASGAASPLGRPLPAAALAQLETLAGMLRIAVGADADAWQADFRFGAGPVPAEPRTTVWVSAADAAALKQGTLDPMQAFLAGRIRVEGDLSFLMQIQAIQMQAASNAG